MKRLIQLLTLTLFAVTTQAQHEMPRSQPNLGQFKGHLDVGDCQTEGFATYDAARQTYTIGGSGKNMWFDDDQFHYLWTTIQGDFILRAEFKFHGAGVDAHRKVGWIVKNDLEPNTPHVNATVHGDGLTSLQYRRDTGGDTEETISPDTFPDVFQLERRGNEFIFSTAKFGGVFTTVSTSNEAIGNEVFIGLYVCSHNPDILETATFRNVRITRPAPEDLQEYSGYIGSRLEILDVATGHRRVVHTDAGSLQAPNWTPDGQALIYNAGGRLYRYELADGRISPLPTGPATSNNNDHVLSFDGNYIGISNHDPDSDYTSTIYRLPVDGSAEPTRVTLPGVGASYLHGWSPDNKTMLLTGERNGQLDIYAVDVATGKERQLTDEATLDDGSEYSPDGRHVYFNSSRTGTMQLWRMQPDGKQPTQLTTDAYNDWFPHVSPDGRSLVFLSYQPEVAADDHPFYRHCLLRRMPVAGGEPTVVAYLYGGQGTINVPSWSPDSRFVAFVSNSQ